MSAEPFPNTLVEVITYFRDEAVCREFLAGLRWPNGVACPFCQCDKVGHVTTRALWRCKTCRRQFSVKKGTIFEDSPIPLSKWLPAIWLYSAGKKGRSSHQLARNLGVTQKSAWFITYRVRLASRRSPDALSSGEAVGGLDYRGRSRQEQTRAPSPWVLGQAGR